MRHASTALLAALVSLLAASGVAFAAGDTGTDSEAAPDAKARVLSPEELAEKEARKACLLYTSPSPRDRS